MLYKYNKPVIFSLGITVMASLFALQPALAQDNEGVKQEDTIIVTGTRRLGRTVGDSPVPIDVLNASVLTQEGFTETNMILNSLLPSFNFPQPSVTDGTDSVRPATLRGLSPDHTLVLINGKRRHTSALLNVNGSVGRGSSAVDLNTIPTAAIKRIEVLRDGASAQYGSDAIAGVINIILRDDREGGNITASFGQYSTSLPGVKQVTGVATDASGIPLHDSRGNIELNRSNKNRKAHDGETYTINGNIGLPVGKDGFLNISGEYRSRNPTNRSGFDPRQQFADPADVREVTFNRLNHRFGNAYIDNVLGFFNMGKPVNDSVEFYSFGSFNERNGESAGFYRRAKDSRNVPAIHPDGFLPLITTNISDKSLAGGFRGEISGWNWDVSTVWGENQFDFGVKNSLNTSLGPNSQTKFDAGGTKFRHYVVNADVQRLIDVGWLKNSVSVAFGGEYRDEGYRIRQGEVASFIQGPFPGAAGSQVFPGFQPSNAVNASRHNWSGYVDVEADLTDRFNIDIAGRIEDYSDFGTTVNGKVAARYQLLGNFALRGAVSSGFRAPSLAQRFFTSTATVFTNGIPDETGTFPVGSNAAIALGATPLKAEDAFNISAGGVFDLPGGFKISVDYYRIKINDRIVLTENLPGSVVIPILQANGINGVTRARFFINGIDTRTQGVDVVASYKLQTARLGDFDFTAGFNVNDTNVTKTNALPGPLAQVNPNLVLFGRREQTRFEKGQPKSKLNLSSIWSLGQFGATIRANRYGKTIDPGTTAANDEVLSSKWLIDTEVRLRATQAVQLAVGANNVFDQYPDASPTGARPNGSGNFSNFNAIFPYSGFSPFGFNGRFVYARASLDF